MSSTPTSVTQLRRFLSILEIRHFRKLILFSDVEYSRRDDPTANAYFVLCFFCLFRLNKHKALRGVVRGCGMEQRRARGFAGLVLAIVLTTAACQAMSFRDTRAACLCPRGVGAPSPAHPPPQRPAWFLQGFAQDSAPNNAPPRRRRKVRWGLQPLVSLYASSPMGIHRRTRAHKSNYATHLKSFFKGTLQYGLHFFN